MLTSTRGPITLGFAALCLMLVSGCRFASTDPASYPLQFDILRDMSSTTQHVLFDTTSRAGEPCLVVAYFRMTDTDERYVQRESLSGSMVFQRFNFERPISPNRIVPHYGMSWLESFPNGRQVISINKSWSDTSASYLLDLSNGKLTLLMTEPFSYRNGKQFPSYPSSHLVHHSIPDSSLPLLTTHHDGGGWWLSYYSDMIHLEQEWSFKVGVPFNGYLECDPDSDAIADLIVGSSAYSNGSQHKGLSDKHAYLARIEGGEFVWTLDTGAGGGSVTLLSVEGDTLIARRERNAFIEDGRSSTDILSVDIHTGDLFSTHTLNMRGLTPYREKYLGVGFDQRVIELDRDFKPTGRKSLPLPNSSLHSRATIHGPHGDSRDILGWTSHNGTVFLDSSLTIVGQSPFSINQLTACHDSSQVAALGWDGSTKVRYVLTSRWVPWYDWWFWRWRNVLAYTLGIPMLASLVAVWVRYELLRRRNRRMERIAAKRRRDLLQALLRDQDKDRKDIARVLHDEITQDLAGYAMILQALGVELEHPDYSSKITRIAMKLREDMGKVRDLSHQLYAPELTLTMKSLLDGLLASLSVPKQLSINIEADDELNPGDTIRSTVYHIAWESIRNVIRHASASSVTLSCKQQQDVLVLCIKDNGVGMTNHIDPSTRTFGLLTMQERAEAVGGQLSVMSQPGEGTTVTARVPLNTQPSTEGQ